MAPTSSIRRVSNEHLTAGLRASPPAAVITLRDRPPRISTRPPVSAVLRLKVDEASNQRVLGHEGPLKQLDDHIPGTHQERHVRMTRCRRGGCGGVWVATFPGHGMSPRPG